MSKSRPLTDGEIKLAQGLFGDSIDYGRVRIHDHPFFMTPVQPNFSGVTPGNNIYIKGAYREDYSKTGPQHSGFFLHELTHVWQYQNNIFSPIAQGVKDYFDSLAKGNTDLLDPAKYSFVLDEKKDLMDYPMEQQAAIVQEYYYLSRAHQTRHFPPQRDQCKNDLPPAEKEKLYEKVLAKFLKDPGYACKKPRPLRLPHFRR